MANYYIEEFEQLIQKNQSMFTKRENQKQPGVFTYYYVYNGFRRYLNDKKLDIYREMRGAVYNSNIGTIYPSVPKFFNYNENELFDKPIVGDKKIINSVMKMDGSLIIPYEYKGEIYFKTIRSFDNEVLDRMYEELDNKLEDIKDIVKEFYKQGLQPLFEYISPNNKIVVTYNKPELVLIMVRKLDTLEIINDFRNLELLQQKHLPFKIAPVYKEHIGKTLQELKDKMRDYDKTGIEGFVVCFENNSNTDLVKMKTDWYIKQHHYSALSLNQIKTRLDILDLILEGKEDDIISDIIEVNEFIEKLKEKLIKEYDIFVKIFNANKKNDIKIIAENIKHYWLQKIMFKVLRQNIENDDMWKYFIEGFKDLTLNKKKEFLYSIN